MLILSHRGYHQRVPENTVEAFAQAMAMGVDGIETDLRRSADGLLILFHDRHAGGRDVAGYTRAELSAVVGYTVPTLDEAFEHCPQDLLWNLEIKSLDAIDLALDALDRYSERRLLVTSFWHQAVVEVAERSDAACGFLVGHRPADQATAPLVPPRLIERIGAIVWKHEFLDARAVEQARELGLTNWVYSVHTPRDHQDCVRWGLDGVISDLPELAFAAAGR